MRYYEVAVADIHYKGEAPLTYSFEEKLQPGNIVTVPLRGRNVAGFVVAEAKKPSFDTKPIAALLSDKLLPPHCLKLAVWLKNYYQCTLSEALRQFAPTKPTVRQMAPPPSQAEVPEIQLDLDLPLTDDQQAALAKISYSKSTTVLLHGETGTGKTRVYLELAKKVIAEGSSAIILTPEIALTSQLSFITAKEVACPVFVFHSQLTPARRRKIWLSILETDGPVVVVGPRSALFSPVNTLGLIVLDEAHEPAYKQEQKPHYHAGRAASQLGALTGAKVVLGTATPSIADYYLADKHQAVVRMTRQAVDADFHNVDSQVIDLKERANFTQNPYLSNQLIEAVRETLGRSKQVMLYLNRRGSARLILCTKCSWQLLCPHCDVPLIYHGDGHLVRCHICGFHDSPPLACPKCNNPDLVYRSIGTKALMDAVSKLFPEYRLARFDSDNVAGEHIHEVYDKVRQGEVDIIVGTQLIAKGFDLPLLGLVGIVSAETSLALPDYTAEERAFQLLYQVIGRVGRGHTHGRVIVQSYSPGSIVLQSALQRDYQKLYKHVIVERKQFRFPPFSYLLKLTCRRATAGGAEQAAINLRQLLLRQKLPVEVIGPAPGFYARRGRYYYWQLVVKSKSRDHLIKLAEVIPSGWTIDLDPMDLL